MGGCIVFVSPQNKLHTTTGLPLEEEDVENLLSCIRFPFLQHQNLVEAARNAVLHEANAQHLVVNALSARLSAYEPAEGENSQRPRNSMLRAAVPGKGGR